MIIIVMMSYSFQIFKLHCSVSSNYKTSISINDNSYGNDINIYRDNYYLDNANQNLKFSDNNNDRSYNNANSSYGKKMYY